MPPPADAEGLPAEETETVGAVQRAGGVGIARQVGTAFAEAAEVRLTGVVFTPGNGALADETGAQVPAGDDAQGVQVPEEDLTAADRRFDPGDLALVDPALSVERRVTPGGGSTESVHRQIEALRRVLSPR